MHPVEELDNIANKMRKYILAMAVEAGGAHIAPAYSIVEVLTTLYFNVMNISPINVDSDNRDRFILSKGHACTAIYAVLAEKGFFDKRVLKTFSQSGSILGEHPDMHLVPGVEFSSGSLGHGLSYGCGIALSGKLDHKQFKTYVLMGDGECQEGSVWEAAMFANHHQLNNLIAIIDHNKIQGIDRTENILSLHSLAKKWKAFGWEVTEVAGHNTEDLINLFTSIQKNQSKPMTVILNTIKGKGVSFMEDSPLWHFRLPNEEEMKTALHELGIESLKKVLP